MTLAERRADIGRLIAIGMTPQQASRGVFIEATIIGITGSLAGLILGAVLTIPVQLLVNTATGNRFEFVPLSPLAAIISVVMGLLVTLAATYPIARQAGNVSPLEMIFSQRKGPAKVSNMLSWLGLGLLVLGAIVELYISFGISGAAQMTLALLGSSTGHMIILFGLLLLVPGVLALWFKVLRQRIGNRLGLTTG